MHHTGEKKKEKKKGSPLGCVRFGRTFVEEFCWFDQTLAAGMLAGFEGCGNIWGLNIFGQHFLANVPYQYMDYT